MTIFDEKVRSDLTVAAPSQVTRADRRFAGKRVLLVGMYYAPENTGSAPYTTDVAEDLAAAGAEVHVVTTAPHYPQWERQASAARGWSTELRNGVHVHRAPAYVPASPTMAKRLVYEGSFVAAALPYLARIKPDVVIGTSPNLFSAALARAVAKSRKVGLVQLVQDIVSSAASQTAQASDAGLASRMLGKLEGWALQAGGSVTVPSAAFRPSIENLGVEADRLHTLPNWSRLEAAVDVDSTRRSAMGWDNHFVVLHTGNIGQKQGLDQLAPAIKEIGARDASVKFVFMGDGNQRAVLEAAIAGLPNAEVLPPVSDADYLATLRAADVLLVHERDTVLDISLPSKLTSYFAAGRPIVAVANELGATAAEIDRSRAGVVVPHHDATTLFETLGRIRSDREYGSQLAKNGMEYRATDLLPETGLDKVRDLVAAELPAV